MTSTRLLMSKGVSPLALNFKGSTPLCYLREQAPKSDAIASLESYTVCMLYSGLAPFYYEFYKNGAFT